PRHPHRPTGRSSGARDRRQSPARAGGRLLSRHRQGQEPALLRREPEGREPARPDLATDQRADHPAARAGRNRAGPPGEAAAAGDRLHSPAPRHARHRLLPPPRQGGGRADRRAAAGRRRLPFRRTQAADARDGAGDDRGRGGGHRPQSFHRRAGEIARAGRSRHPGGGRRRTARRMRDHPARPGEDRAELRRHAGDALSRSRRPAAQRAAAGVARARVRRQTRVRLSRNVVILGVVSLLADVSSDMVVPLLPAFVISLGGGAAFVGAIEGAAEATAALLKYLSGGWADKARRLLPLAVIGYALAGLARPFLAVARAPWQVLLVRNLDRVGKGVRTSPRDKLLAGSVEEGRLAEAFAFHRGMDNAGAAVGPLVAAGLLLLWPGDLRRVFLFAAIPGALAVLALFAVREEEA